MNLERDTAIKNERNHGATFEEIGEKYGLTKQRVQQICKGKYRPKGSKKGRPTGTRGADDCPRCGATKSHQKWPIKNKPIDWSKAEMIDSFNPVDVAYCKYCGAFRVVKLETELGMVIDWQTEFECWPNYCPICGREL